MWELFSGTTTTSILPIYVIALLVYVTNDTHTAVYSRQGTLFSPLVEPQINTASVATTPPDDAFATIFCPLQN